MAILLVNHREVGPRDSQVPAPLDDNVHVPVVSTAPRPALGERQQSPTAGEQKGRDAETVIACLSSRVDQGLGDVAATAGR